MQKVHREREEVRKRAREKEGDRAANDKHNEIF